MNSWIDDVYIDTYMLHDVQFALHNGKVLHGVVIHVAILLPRAARGHNLLIAYGWHRLYVVVSGLLSNT